MNEIEKAIRSLELRKMEHRDYDDNYEFFDLAIQALQEKAERDKTITVKQAAKPLK